MYGVLLAFSLLVGRFGPPRKTVPQTFEGNTVYSKCCEHALVIRAVGGVVGGAVVPGPIAEMSLEPRRPRR